MIEKNNIISVEDLLTLNPYELDETGKDDLFKKILLEELSFHYENNSMYRQFCIKKKFNPQNFVGTLEEIPAIAVSVFKELGGELNSVSKEELKLTLQSSATSGIPSTVVLDKVTSKRQAKAMIKVMQEFIGKDRKPFLIADIAPKPENLMLMGARFAAVGGYLNFASSAEYILSVNEKKSFSFNPNQVVKYLNDIKEGQSVVLFGFTYILYSSILKSCYDNSVKLTLPPNSKIIHIGGWKKLENEKVSKELFNQMASEVFGIPTQNVIDVYGFTEQMGLNYPDCSCGFKHVPLYSDIIVRDSATGRPLPIGEIGSLSFLTPIPHSYPGNVIQTDDLGFITEGVCSAGRNGKRFKILGRLKKAEIRGCGDILANKMTSLNIAKRSDKQFGKGLQIIYHASSIDHEFENDKSLLQAIIRDLNARRKWLDEQPIDGLIGLIGEVARKWSLGEGDLAVLKNTGLGFLSSWCSPEHLNRISTFGLRGNRLHIDGFSPLMGSKKEYLTANSRGLVGHWLAGNVQVLGMFALVQSILTKNVNLLKISSRDDGTFLRLINAFKGEKFVTKGGVEIKGDDLLKTISIIYFPHEYDHLGQMMSQASNVRIAWGGREAVETVSSYAKKYDTEDIIFGPKLSFSVIAKELLSSERVAKKVARKVAVDVSIFDQTGCASPHNIYVEKGGNIDPETFSEILNGAMKRVSLQIIKGDVSIEQLASIHSIRGLYDFKGRVWGNEDLTWTVIYDDTLTLNQPVYSRVVMVHPVEHIEDTIGFINEDIQTIGLGAEGRKALDYATKAIKSGASRCPELGKMLNFESPWDGIILMDRLVRWSTMGGPLI